MTLVGRYGSAVSPGGVDGAPGVRPVEPPVPPRPVSLAGRSELAGVLRVPSETEALRISRSPGFPAPVALLAAGTVWDADEVRAWAAGREAPHDVRAAGRVLCGRKEAARVLGLTGPRVTQMSARLPSFPRPVASLALGPLWDRR